MEGKRKVEIEIEIEIEVFSRFAADWHADG